VRLVNFSQQGDKPLALKIRRFAHNKEFEQSLVSGSSGFNRPTNVRRGLRRGAGFRSIRRCREIHHRRRWSPRSDPRHGRDLEDLSRLRSEPAGGNAPSRCIRLLLEPVRKKIAARRRFRRAARPDPRMADENCGARGWPVVDGAVRRRQRSNLDLFDVPQPTDVQRKSVLVPNKNVIFRRSAAAVA
jgi:hypothetical protein